MKPPTPSPIADLTDIELITAVSQDRSQQALQDLYRRYHLLLRSVIARVMNTDTDCDDALQDVFIQVWERAHLYSPEKGNLLGWLITLARRRGMDRVRKMCAYKHATDRYEKMSEHSKPCGSDLFAVDLQVFQNELKGQMKMQLNKLPQAQQEAVHLTFFQGLTQREIAAQLSIPLGTIKTRIELGMQKLGRALASEWAAYQCAAPALSGTRDHSLKACAA